MGRREIRHKQILQFILELGRIPAISLLAERLGVSERTIYRDLEAITERIPEVAVEDIHRLLMLRLRHRVPEMKDRDLLRLAEFFLPKKSETRVEGDLTTVIELKAWNIGDKRDSD